MKPETRPREPGVPVESARFLGRGLYLGMVALVTAAVLAWLIIEWLKQ